MDKKAWGSLRKELCRKTDDEVQFFIFMIRDGQAGG